MKSFLTNNPFFEKIHYYMIEHFYMPSPALTNYLENEFDYLIDLMSQEGDNEPFLIDYFNQFIRLVTELDYRYKNTLKKLLNKQFFAKLDSTRYEVNILLLAMQKKYFQLVDKLLSYEIDINVHVRDYDTSFFPNQMNALMHACEFDNLYLIKKLLFLKANLIAENSIGSNVLFFVHSEESWALILNAAHQQNCIEKLIFCKNMKHELAFAPYCRTGHASLALKFLKLLLEYQYPFEKNVSLERNNLLEQARTASLGYPQQFKEFDEICNLLKDIIAIPRLEAPIKINLLTYNSAFSELYSEPLVHKDIVLASVLAQLYSLLSNTEKCIQYLQHLNSELERYHLETLGYPYPRLSESSYRFEIVYSYQYPIPNEDYQSIKKSSILPRYLMQLFTQHGLPNKAYRWFHYIPHHEANDAMSKGVFALESTLSVGLYHGEFSHMIQRAILIYALENNEFYLDYLENNEPMQLTLQDILKGVIEINLSEKTFHNWSDIFDSLRPESIHFSDPYRLHSFIMKQGKEHRLSILSDYLIDRFCKGFKENLEVLNQHCNAYLDLSCYAEKIKDLKINDFKTVPYLLQYALDKEMKKDSSKCQVITANESYGISEVFFKPNANFKPKRFKLN